MAQTPPLISLAMSPRLRTVRPSLPAASVKPPAIVRVASTVAPTPFVPLVLLPHYFNIPLVRISLPLRPLQSKADVAEVLMVAPKVRWVLASEVLAWPLSPTVALVLSTCALTLPWQELRTPRARTLPCIRSTQARKHVVRSLRPVLLAQQRWKPL